MKRSTISRAVNEHGLISNALAHMPLETQVAVASVINRSYEITVPWNVPVVPFPTKTPTSFPKVNDLPAGFVCTTTEKVMADGNIGTFYGPVN